MFKNLVVGLLRKNKQKMLVTQEIIKYCQFDTDGGKTNPTKCVASQKSFNSSDFDMQPCNGFIGECDESLGLLCRDSPIGYKMCAYVLSL